MEVSRRNFLKGALAAGALGGAALVGCTSSAQGTAEPGKTASETNDNLASTGTEKSKWSLPELVSTPSSTVDCDIVVVGSGMAGMSAALTAAENGMDVIIVEKGGALGGSTAFAEGCFAVESPIQREMGIDLTVRDALTQEFDYQHHIVNTLLWYEVANASGENIQWLLDHGAEFEGISQSQKNKTMHLYKDHRGATVIAALEAEAGKAGIEIMKSTRAVHVLKEGDAAVGVQVVASGNEVININAKAVILAAGGVGLNTDLVSQYTTRNGDNYYFVGAPSNEGDDILMAMEAGMGKPCKIGAPGIGVTVDPLGVSSHLACGAGLEPTNLWVNQDGERFCNEALAAGYIFSSNAIESQIKAFSLFDQAQLDRLVNDGCTVGWGSYVPAGTQLTDMPGEIESMMAQGSEVYKGDTIKALAESMGCKPEALQATLDEYNGYCAAGEDEKYQKPAENLVEMKTGPFYACRVKGSVLNWKGGIRINTRCNIVDEEGKEIPGLYCAGVPCAGFQGESYGYLLPSSTQGIALGTGRISGARSAEYVKGA